MGEPWFPWNDPYRTNEVPGAWWFQMSFARQMAEIEGEISRVLRDKKKLERIRRDMDYQGEPQIIRHIFGYIKKDPRNTERLEEVVRAEELTYAFLAGAPGAPSQEEIGALWARYMNAYLQELEGSEGGG